MHYDDQVPTTPKLVSTIHQWWKEQSSQHGSLPALGRLLAIAAEFLRESTPSSRKRRYGDTDYDWEYRVDTTAATVHWKDRLAGMFHSPYQPTEPALFREMLSHLKIDFHEFTFVDIGSGKGRALLMAADLPFRRVLGVELLPELHRVAEQNIANYAGESRQCFAMESICQDARDFVFPLEPTLLYLFNPLPEAGLTTLLGKLEKSLRENPRSVYVLYHNPILESVLSRSTALTNLGGTHQFSIYGTAEAVSNIDLNRGNAK